MYPRRFVSDTILSITSGLAMGLSDSRCAPPGAVQEGFNGRVRLAAARPRSGVPKVGGIAHVGKEAHPPSPWTASGPSPQTIELELPADEMEELWLEELDWIDLLFDKLSQFVGFLREMQSVRDFDIGQSLIGVEGR